MTRRSTLFIAVLLTGIALAGCSGPAADPGADESPTTLKTEVYREIDGDELNADVCLPDSSSTPTGSAMILLHGGGFREGSRKSMRSLCEQFAAQGIVGVAIDYRLLPDYSYPTQLEDAVAAIDWLSTPEVSTRYGVDPERIGMLGSSAGAIITATIAARADSGIAAAVALSPVADMTPDGLTLGQPSKEAAATILTYLGCSDVTDCDHAREASPLYSVSAESTPTFLVVGSNELVPQEQAEALHDALDSAGVPTQLVVVEGSKHGQSLMSTKARTEMAAFLQEWL